MKVLDFNGVWEKYKIKFIKQKDVCWEEVWALENVNFKVEKGDIVGVIGKNGAGKTTLLKLIAGMLVPDKGEIHIKGKVSALMELGAGFNPEFTGIENIRLNAAIYGISEAVLTQKMNDIVEFADLGKFIYAPIKYYSQGMYMRLVFALAIFVEPDILLIDDILAVGDEEARQKCIKKIFELKQAGKTIILVSHNMNMVSKLCNRLILLEKGKITQEGLTEKAIPYYLETVGDKKGIAVLEKEGLRVIFNNGKITLNYNGFPLTKAAGGYVSFFIPFLNSWSSSSSLSWQVKSFETDKIIAEGKSHEGIILQTWTLQIKKNCFQWQAEIKDEAVKQLHTDLLLIPKYKEWQTLDKSSDFPNFASKSNWQDLGLNSCPDAVLGISGAWQSQDCPGLILEQENKDILLKLFNTGYEQEARVIQWELDSKNKNLVSIKIFPEEDKFTEYIADAKQNFIKKQEEEKQRLLFEQQAELDRLRVQRTISGDNLRLYADVGNKALRLYYKDKEITKSSGLHNSFLLKNSWYDLSSAEWQVEKNDNVLTLYFHWQQLKLVQSWRLYFQKDSVLWRAESQSGKFPEFKMLKFGLLLNPEYKSFFCGRQQDSFPDEFTSWQDMPLTEPQAELCGLRKQADFPAIVLENRQGLSCIIQNSNKRNSCRILQLRFNEIIFDKKEGFSFQTRIKLLEDNSFITEYIEKLNQKIYLKKQKELVRLQELHTIGSGNLRVFTDIDSKSIRLYYKDVELTARGGAYSVFYTFKEGYRLNQCRWDIDKLSSSKMILKLYYESISLLQIWELTCEKDDSVKIKIEVEVQEPVSFVNQDIKIEFNDIFKSWATAHEQGNFDVNDYINNIGPIKLKDNKISEIVLEFKGKLDCAKLFFVVFSNLEKQIIDIYKIKEANNNYTCVNASLILPSKHNLTKPGKYTYFDGKIALGNNFVLGKNINSSGVAAIEKGDVKFIFDRGRGIISWKGNELTTGLGIYSSMRSGGIWYDSYQATWEIKHKDKNKIIIVGDWPHIPVSQTWKLELADKNIIFWDINIIIYRSTELEFEQANIMLLSRYKKWTASNFAQGDFLDDYTKNYDIIPFRFWYGKTEKLSAFAETLPKVIFSCNAGQNETRGIVENTDSLYEARLLQYQRINQPEVNQGERPYFRGVIEIKSNG